MGMLFESYRAYKEEPNIKHPLYLEGLFLGYWFIDYSISRLL